MRGRGRERDAGRHGETAAHYLVAAVPRALPDEQVEVVRRRLAARPYDSVALICVTDEQDLLLGFLPITDFVALADGATIGAAMRKDRIAVHADVDQERVASMALHHAVSAVPVVDYNGHLLGIVPPAALIHILRHEHVEDLHRLAGIGREDARVRESIESPPLRRLRRRLPWLVIGLIGSMIATWVMASFEAALQSKMSIAFFVPGLVYLADAIGTQTEAITVRWLSLSHSPPVGLLGGEMRTGLLIGLTLGLITLPVVWAVFGDLRLALAVSTALFFAGGVATTIGLLLPWMLQQFGTDPAYGSGPLATIIQDVLSLVVYFAVVSAIVL